LILLDWNMAPMNGAEFLKELATESGGSSAPVVVLTADTRIADEVASRALAGFVAKPVSLGVLLELVARYCA
jgi:DNA-binding response OmpR family regulator